VNNDWLGDILAQPPRQDPLQLLPSGQSTSLDHPRTIDAGQPVFNFLSHLWRAVQGISLFSLFFHEIYSEPDLLRRRNPRFWGVAPAKKTAKHPLFFCCSSLLRPNNRVSPRMMTPTAQVFRQRLKLESQYQIHNFLSI